MANPVRIVGGNYDDNNNDGIQAQVTQGGALLVQDGGFVCSDTDKTDATYYYYGFIDKDGRWYIMRKTITDPNAYRFAKGDSGYSLAWAGKVSQDYQLYSVTF